MKWLKIIISVIILLVIIVIILISRSNRFQRDGEITLPGLTAPVKVLRDEKGMPYIYADNTIDAVRAHGFVTAQDRLFQMELTRLFSEGRICELAGEGAKGLDTRMRTLGFHRNAKKHVKILNKDTKKLMQAYVDGVNQYIKTRKKYHPVEFRLAGIKPGLWSIEDSMAIFYYMGWNSAANMKTEIIAQMLVEKLGVKKAKEIFPVNTNPDDVSVTGYNYQIMNPGKAGLPTGISADRKLMAFLNEEVRSLKLGSNNWAVNSGLSVSGKPIVSNDPHLDSRMLPGPWYPAGIITPEFRAVGVSIPGISGMVVGRNEHIAIGVTNSYNDGQDLYVETIDPGNPDNYLEGRKSIPFKIIRETLRIKDKKGPDGYRNEEITIRLTGRGPVISDVIPGLKTKKIITVRWAPYETMQPSIGLDKIMTAKSVSDIKKALGDVTCIMLNLVFADDQGNIGWQTTGRIPVRSQGDGTIPNAVKDSIDNWKGWIPYEKMPQSYNPSRGWLGTCNHNTIKKDYPYYVSSHFAPYYRYARLKQLMGLKKKTNVDDHWKYQRDIKNLLAEKVAPVIAKALMASKDTEIMGKILSEWDYTDDKDKAAPAVFQTVFREFAFLTFRDELGDELAKTMLDNWYFWQNRLEVMILDGKSAWFDDTATKERETRDDILKRAALDSTKKYGSNPEKWEWGEMHRLEFVSPIMRKGLLKGPLGGGSHPMSGSQETLYRSIYKYSDPFNATTTASLRMVVDFADNDRVLAVLPGGVCARAFDEHTTDQIEAFMNGDKLYWWFSDKMINEHSEYSLKLLP